MSDQQDTVSLKGRYNTLASDRTTYLDKAREASKLTIPSLVPPEGSSASTSFPTPYQSVGARGLNNLANKLLLTLFPPNSTIFKYQIDDFSLEQLTQQQGMRAEVEKGLNRIERAVTNEIETTAMRPVLFRALKLLLVSGNVLLYVIPEGGLRAFRLDRYVTKRDPMGNVLEIITKENVSPMEVDESIRAQVLAKAKQGNDSADSPVKNVELYTQVRRTEKGYEVLQEIEGIILPGSEGTYPEDKSPWLALRWTAMDGEDYGRGFIEEYLGDLDSLEKLSKAIVQGAAIAAKVLFLLKPNARTKAKDLAKAESGDIKDGDINDVSVLQLEKYADFRVAKETRSEIIEALSYSFLLNSAVQRNGERITAEEIRYMATELDTTLGGAYATQSQELQLPLVKVIINNLQRQSRLPELPNKLIKPVITTGIDAIGRGNDNNKLKQFIGDIAQLSPEIVQKYVNMGDLVKRLGTSQGIDMDGLIKTDEQIAQEQQQAQQQQMMMSAMEKLGPNAVTQMGSAMRENNQAAQEATPQQ